LSCRGGSKPFSKWLGAVSWRISARFEKHFFDRVRPIQERYGLAKDKAKKDVNAGSSPREHSVETKAR
jgi:hypothetical protein